MVQRRTIWGQACRSSHSLSTPVPQLIETPSTPHILSIVLIHRTEQFLGRSLRLYIDDHPPVRPPIPMTPLPLRKHGRVIPHERKPTSNTNLHRSHRCNSYNPVPSRSYYSTTYLHLGYRCPRGLVGSRSIQILGRRDATQSTERPILEDIRD